MFYNSSLAPAVKEFFGNKSSIDFSCWSVFKVFKDFVCLSGSSSIVFICFSAASSMVFVCFSKVFPKGE